MNDLIKIEDILFVFQKWTLMVNSKFGNQLKPGGRVDLYDETESKLGSATLVKYLSSRNPSISAIEIDVESDVDDLKRVRYVKAD